MGPGLYPGTESGDNTTDWGSLESRERKVPQTPGCLSATSTHLPYRVLP